MIKHITPARPDLRVRKQNGDLLAAGGEPLQVNAWWYRREAQGDVIMTEVKKGTASTDSGTQKRTGGEK
ncbi:MULTISPECIES: DUF2635 domain-containing protein [Mangrovibacter]|uniref:DUF2635 domain-containing protein n=1 Tax=Mangrovibacter TaxID=451512 RepID=UPI0004D61BBF|nr:DUF2635 domain-containing protein [Mangrovibacter sp. MFB070]KEA51795.1 hypothetical protein DT73_12735 [Mangrovibacter sp. MFB070]